MTRLVLHIGMPKTGTTAFQAFIAGNQEQLAANGLRYPKGVLRGPNHAELAAAFSDRITGVSRRHGVDSPRAQQKFRRRLAQRLRSNLGAAPAWLATSEHIGFQVRQPENIAAMAEYLAGFFDDITVLLSFRRADYWVPSNYVESIKSGQAHLLDAAFVRKRGDVLDYSAFAARWGDAFGHDNIRVVPFLESDKAHPTALPMRLLAAAGISESVTAHWPTPPTVHNPSPSAVAVEVMRKVNAAFDPSPFRDQRRRRAGVPVVRQAWPGPSLALTPDASDELHRCGLVRGGIGTTPYAASDGWPEWTEQRDAPTSPMPSVSDRDVAHTVRLLRRHGVIEPRLIDRPALVARRVAGKLRAG
jgi:hypothetical protein